MIYEVEGGGVGTGETAGGSPIPGSVERSPSQGTFQSHLKTLTRQLLGTDEGGTMELLSVSITPRYHLRTSVEHDYWKQNNADRISHPGLGQKNSKDVRAPTSPLPALRPPHPNTAKNPKIYKKLRLSKNFTNSLLLTRSLTNYGN